MHNLQVGNYSINFNGDFSGDILVDHTNGKDFTGTKNVAKIPFMVMLAVVGEKLRREQIAKLEEQDPMEIVYGAASKHW